MDREDRARFLELLDKLVADSRLLGHAFNEHDWGVIEAVRGIPRAAPLRLAPVKQGRAL